MQVVYLAEKLQIKNFEFLDSGLCTGEYNMKFDTGRTMECSKGKAKPMFRLYGWKPWSVSLGANQKENDIDEKECKERGFDIVRRPTGGRAVLHANEITYSVVTPLPQGLTIHDAYRDIHIFLLEIFEKAGCSGLDFERSQHDFRNHYKNSDMSVSCFASSARYEITHNGKKIVGSAQRLFGNILLQHGSILLDQGHEQLAYVSANKSKRSKEVLKQYILHHSSNLTIASGKKIKYEDIANAAKEIFD